MNLLKIYKPIRPFAVTQNWNNPNPSYADAGFNFTKHNGVDFHNGTNQKKFLVWCPVEDFTVVLVRYMPNGGGHEIWMMSNEKLNVGGIECHAYIVMCHGDRILVPAGYKPKLGELIMIGDNTGFSTGPHVHFGLYRVGWDGRYIEWLDQNDASGSYDPMLYMQREFAVDKADTATLIKSGFRYLDYLTS